MKAAAINLMCRTKIDKMNCLFFRSDEYITAIDIQMNDIFFMDFTQNMGQIDGDFEFCTQAESLSGVIIIQGLPIDIFQYQERLIVNRFFLEGLAYAFDFVESAGHFVFFLQGADMSLGGVFFSRLFDNHRTSVFRYSLDRNDRVALINDIFSYGFFLAMTNYNNI